MHVFRGMLRLWRVQAEKSSQTSKAIRLNWESSARALPIVHRICVSAWTFALLSRLHLDKEIHDLARRLARHGLLEYRLARSRDSEDLVVIEPQSPDYWPRMPQLSNKDTLVLSRFAYMRRRGEEMVLESPRAGALFKICNPSVATALAILSTPQQIAQLRRQSAFPGVELLALLVDSQILFGIKAGSEGGSLRRAEGDDESHSLGFS